VHKSTWKRGEQTLAKFFGTTRTPLSGGNSKVTRSDSLHKRLYFEMKKGKYVPKTLASILELYRKTEERALKEGKIPILVIRETGRPAPTPQWLGWIRLTYLGIPRDMMVAVSLGDLRAYFETAKPSSTGTAVTESDAV